MNTKQLQLVTFKQAKKLKEAGFDWFVYHWYNSDGTLSNSTNPHDRNGGRCGLSTPSVALALKWLRDVKGFSGCIDRNVLGWYWVICKANNGTCVLDFDLEELCTYELAEASMLDRLLTLIKK